MEKQSELESPKLKALDSPKSQKVKAEKPQPKVEHISSRALPIGLLSIAERLGKELVSNQAYLVNDIPLIWVGPQKKIFYGPSAKEASGATMLQAATTAGII